MKICNVLLFTVGLLGRNHIDVHSMRQKCVRNKKKDITYNHVLYCKLSNCTFGGIFSSIFVCLFVNNLTLVTKVQT